jgi:hypothetical protein
VSRRQEIGRMDTKIEELKAQRGGVDQRASEKRQNLDVIQKDAVAAPLRAKLSKRLEQFASDGDRLGRQVVDLQNKRMELRIELEDSLQTLDLTAPVPRRSSPEPRLHARARGTTLDWSQYRQERRNHVIGAVSQADVRVISTDLRTAPLAGILLSPTEWQQDPGATTASSRL